MRRGPGSEVASRRAPPRVRRGLGRRAPAVIVATVAVCLAAGAIGLALAAGSDGRPQAAAVRAGAGVATPSVTAEAARDHAFAAAVSFLNRYELPSGRVVRFDQGADTVSEGEAYAMLLSVAAGIRPRFDAAWSWTQSHLLQPSGLLAWHWADGRVTDPQPASDADVDAAYALALAAGRFGEPADLQSAAALASAVVRQETVAVPMGQVLVAGPWAVGPPSYANPSYASPSELTALGALVGDPQDFVSIAAGTRGSWHASSRSMRSHPTGCSWTAGSCAP